MGADEEGKALATPEYWDSRYTTSTSNEPTHEWFRSYDALEPFFSTHLFPTYPSSSNPQIVHLGSGDSTIPFDLATKNGYKNQLCLDFSQVVVDMMSERHKEVEGITWRWADVRDMQGQDDGSVDVAFDKGTLDAMIHGSPWNPPDQVREDTGRYMREVSIPTIILRYTGGILLSMIKVGHAETTSNCRSIACSSPRAFSSTSLSVNRTSSSLYSTQMEVYGICRWRRWEAWRAHLITSPSCYGRNEMSRYDFKDKISRCYWT